MPEASELHEVERRPPQMAEGPGPLSRRQRELQVERGFAGLYRWYLDRSQSRRNWSADRSFDWRALRTDHSDEVLRIVEGFYAVEQYVPDYTALVVQRIRESYGRSQFTLRWGAEEEKHSDLWRNVLLFSRRRSPEWIEQYTSDLRSTPWVLAWDQPIHMLIYTVLQERATELIYQNLQRLAQGELERTPLTDAVDPVLAAASRTIALDEAAHYHFFLEAARLYLYYFPEETLQALVDVLNNFLMPAATIVPDYDGFTKVLYEARVFGRYRYAREVARPALELLGVQNIKLIEEGLKRGRQIPGDDGELRDSTLLDGLDHRIVESAVERLFARVGSYEAQIGFDELAPTRFVPYAWTSEQSMTGVATAP